MAAGEVYVNKLGLGSTPSCTLIDIGSRLDVNYGMFSIKSSAGFEILIICEVLFISETEILMIWLTLFPFKLCAIIFSLVVIILSVLISSYLFSILN